MAFPTVQSVTTSAFGAAATSWAVSMPATVASGDLLVMIFNPNTGIALTPPTGWTALQGFNNFFAYKIQVAAKVSDGTEGGTTATVTGSASKKATAQVYRVTGWSGDLSAGVASSEVNDNSALNSPNPPALTPSWGALDTLWIVGTGTDGTATVSSYPTNYTSNNTYVASGGSGPASGKCWSATASRQLNVATEDPGSFVPSAAVTWYAVTIAVRPVASGTQYTQSLTASLSIAGSQAKRTGKVNTASLSVSGVRPTAAVSRGITGTLSLSGAIPKRISRALGGSLTFSGVIAKSRVTLKSLTATLSFSGSIVKRSFIPVAGTFTLSGSITKRTSRSNSASLTLSGSQAKKTSRSNTGTLAFAGSIAKSGRKTLSGALSMAGSTIKKTSKPLSAGLTLGGNVIKSTAKAFTASLQLAGNVVGSILGGATHYTQALSGTLTMSGSIAKSTIRSLLGSLKLYGFHARPGEVFWNTNGTKDEPYALAGTRHFTMSDGTELIVYVASDPGGYGMGYQIRSPDGTLGEWTRFDLLPSGYESRCTRNGDIIYVLACNFSNANTRLYKLVYSAGTVTQSSIRVSVETFTGGHGQGIYYDPVNDLVHVHFYEGTTGVSQLRAYSPSLVLQYTSTYDEVGAGTNMSASPQFNALAGTGNTIFAVQLDSGDFKVLRFVAGPSSYTTQVLETSPVFQHGSGGVTAIWDGTYLQIFAHLNTVPSQLYLRTRTAADTYSDQLLLSGTQMYTAYEALQPAVFRRLGTSDLLVVYTHSSPYDIMGLKRRNGVWDASPTILVGGGGEEYGGHSASADDTNDTGYAHVLYNYRYPAPFGIGVKRVAVPGTFLQSLTAALGLVGSTAKRTARSLTASLSFAGASNKRLPKTMTGVLSFTGALSSNSVFHRILTATLSLSGSISYKSVIDFIEQQARAFQRYIATLIRNKNRLEFKTRTPVQLQMKHRMPREVDIKSSQKKISIKVVGPEEMAYKRGTAVLFETTFTDPDTGAVYDPDTGTVKAYLQKPDGTYVTGWDPAVAGQTMTKYATGIYRVTYQSARTDPTGTWIFESEGKVGTETSLDDAKIQVKA